VQIFETYFEMTKRLTLSQSDKKIAGVCSGIAKYFDQDPTLIRVIWLILFFCCGIGLFAYLLSWLIIPKE